MEGGREMEREGGWKGGREGGRERYSVFMHSFPVQKYVPYVTSHSLFKQCVC